MMVPSFLPPKEEIKLNTSSPPPQNETIEEEERPLSPIV
jgi:hypothetical protein